MLGHGNRTITRMYVLYADALYRFGKARSVRAAELICEVNDMQLRDAVKNILAKQNKTQQWLSEQMGYSSRQVLNDALARGHIRLDTLMRICECLGCEVAILYKDWEYTLTEGKK